MAQGRTVRRHWLGIRSRLVLGVVLILAPLLVLQSREYSEDLERRRRMVLSSFQQTATVAGQLVDMTFHDAEALARTLALELQETELDPERLDELLDRAIRYRPELANLGVFNVEGEQIAAALGAPEKFINISDREYFREALQDEEPALSEVLQGRIVSGPIVIASAQFRAQNGEASGVVNVVLHLSRLAERFDLEFRNNQGIFLLDKKGRVAFHTLAPDMNWQERDWSRVPAVQRALEGQPVLTTDFSSPLVRDRRVAALVPAPESGWVVGMTWPAESAFGAIEQSQREKLFLLGVLALLALAGAVVLSAFISRPIRKLSAASEAFGRGESGSRAEVRSGDEFEDLARAFNDMADTLEEERSKREVFISTVMHDMRNTLNPLKTGAQLLKRAEPERDARGGKLLGTILVQIAQIERLISDLGDLGQIDAGSFRVEMQPLDLTAVAREIVDSQQVTTEKHRLTLDAPGPVQISGDRVRIAQVLLNLVSNALKYSPEGGAVKVQLVEKGDDVELCVIDEGCGLRAEEIELLFRPYSRLRRTERIRGLGLGLFICKAIVEAHGGRITAWSKGPGFGATFCVVLPRARTGGA